MNEGWDIEKEEKGDKKDQKIILWMYVCKQTSMRANEWMSEWASKQASENLPVVR